MRRLALGSSLALSLGLAVACGGGGGSGGGGGAAGDLLVFSADGRVAGTFELFASAPPFDNPVAISGPVVPGSFASAPAWSPSKTTLGFISNRDEPTQGDLFLVDPSEGKPVNMTAGFDSSVGSPFIWSPDCDRIAFFAQHEAPQIGWGLYVLTIASKSVVEVSTGDIIDTQAIRFEWQPGSKGPKGNLAYRSDEEVPFRRDLYIVNADGTGHARVNDRGPGVVPNAEIRSFGWSPDGSRLAYTYSDLDFLSERLFVATGLVSQEVTGIVTTDRDVDFWHWLPDSNGIVTVADLLANDEFQLFVAHASGAAPTPLTAVVAPSIVSQTFLSHDGSRVAYVVFTPGMPQTHVLRVVSTSGGGDTLVDNRGAVVARWSPDDTRLAYTHDGYPAGSPVESLRLYVAVPGQAPVEATAAEPLDPDFDVSPANEWSPTGEHVLCSISVPDPADVQGIYATTKLATAPVRLSAPITEEAFLSTQEGSWSGSGFYAAFRVTDANLNDGSPLRVAKPDGSLVIDPLDLLLPSAQSKGYLWR